MFGFPALLQALPPHFGYNPGFPTIVQTLHCLAQGPKLLHLVFTHFHIYRLVLVILTTEELYHL